MASNYSQVVDPASAQQVNPAQITGIAAGQHAQSMLHMMFGPPPVTQSRAFGQDISTTHEDVYAAYEGDNLYLADTVKGFILMNDEWYTSVIPWLQTNQMHIKWNTFEFDRALAGPVPNEGVPRLISHRTRGHEASISRYGLGFEMEGDMIGTDAGLVLYRRQLAGLAQSCLETVNYHTVHSLKTCKTHVQQRQDLMREYGKTLVQIAELEAQNFAIMANDRDGLHQLIEQQRDLVRQQDGEVDTLIVHEDFSFHLQMVAEGSLTEYYQLGPRGQQVITQGPVSDGTFRGIPIFKSRRFKVYDSGPKIQPLVDNVSVGEFYLADANAFRGSNPISSSYKTAHRNMYIYSIENDKYNKLEFNDIFLHSNMFGGAVGDDADKLSPATHAMADDINAQFSEAPETRDDAMAVYKNRAMLENTSTSKSARRVYLMLAHNTDTQQVAPVERFAEFDIDVMTTQDVRQASTSLVNALFNSDSERMAMYSGIAEMMALVQRLEQAPYSEEFMRALSAENIPASADSTGRFRGDPLRVDQTQVIDWAPNAYGGLDLPNLKALTTLPAEGSFLASYPMIMTLAKQGEARGYPADLVNQAKTTVQVVSKLTQRIMGIAGASEAVGKGAVPDWFNVKSPDISVFNNLHIARPPVFLGASGASGDAAPREVPVRVDPDADADDKQGPVVLWTGGPRGDSGQTLVALSTLPRAKILAALLDLKQGEDLSVAANNLATNSLQGSAATLQNFFVGWFATAGADKVGEAEQGRVELVNKLFELFETNKGNPVYATFAQKAVQEAVADIAIIGADFNKAKEIMAAVDAKIKSAPKKYSTKARALTDKEKAEATAFGENLIVLAQGLNAVPAAAAQQARPARPVRARLSSDVLDEIASRLNEAQAGDMSLAQVMSQISENLDATSMALQSFTAVKYDGSNAEEFISALSMSDAPQDAVESFSKRAEQFEAVESQAQEIVNEVVGALSSTMRSDSHFEQFGRDIPTDGKGAETAADAWYRAPLAASPATLRSLAASTKQGRPAVLPADPETGYRYYVAPINGQQLDVSQFTTVMSDVAMLPLVNSRVEVGAAPLSNEPLVHNLMSKRPYIDRHADFRVAGLDSRHETRRVPIGMRRRADGTHALEDDVNAIGSRIDAVNADRARRGLPPADFSREFTEADVQRRELDRATSLARSRAETAEALSHSSVAAAGVRLDQSAVATDPLRRAAMRSHTRRLDRPLGEQHTGLGVSSEHDAALRNGGRRYDRGSYAGAQTSASAQFDVNRHNDFLPDAAFLRESRTVYYGGAYEGATPTHPYGHGHGYDHERGYAVQAPFGVGVSGAPMDQGQYRMFYDQYGRPVYVNAGDIVGDAAQLDRFGRPRDGSSLDAPEESEASRKKLHPNAVYRYRKAEEEDDPLVRLAMRVLLETPNTATAWRELLQKNVYLPIAFMVWRLHIEFEMVSIIALQSGIETGANVIGHQSMVFANRAVDHMMHANMTFWHKPVIFNEQFVRIIRNVAPRGYVAGWDMNWIMSADELEEEQRGSLIATPLAVTEKIDHSTVTFIDTTRPRMLPSLTNRQKNQTVLPSHSSAAMAAKIWNLSEQSIANGENAAYLAESDAKVQVRAREGKYWTYNPRDMLYNVKHDGNSPLSGNRTGPGVGPVWRGNGRNMFPNQLDVEQMLRLQ